MRRSRLGGAEEEKIRDLEELGMIKSKTSGSWGGENQDIEELWEKIKDLEEPGKRKSMT